MPELINHIFKFYIALILGCPNSKVLYLECERQSYSLKKSVILKLRYLKVLILQKLCFTDFIISWTYSSDHKPTYASWSTKINILNKVLWQRKACAFCLIIYSLVHTWNVCEEVVWVLCWPPDEGVVHRDSPGGILCNPDVPCMLLL